MAQAIRFLFFYRHILTTMLLLLAACGVVAQDGVVWGCSDVVRTSVNHSDVNVVILGDSNTSIGGDKCDKPQGWNKWFNDAFAPATCRSYARSGATWTNTAVTEYNVREYTDRLGNDNVIYNQINRLKEAYDAGTQPVPGLIIIAAGTNDAWFVSARPSVFGKTAAQAFACRDRFITDIPVTKVLTLAESVRYGCEMLMEIFPDARIVLLTPLQSVAAGTENIRRAGDIIEACGRYMSLKVIRQDYCCGIYSAREKVSRKYTTDGTHTNEAGARRNGLYIAGVLSVE